MYFVLLKVGVPTGTFGNLKKIIEFMEGEDFPSYWTLVRKEDNPLEYGGYLIYKVKLQKIILPHLLLSYPRNSFVAKQVFVFWQIPHLVLLAYRHNLKYK